MQIFIHAGGKQLGPFPIDEVNRRLAQGEWPLDSTKAWYEGAASWMSLANVPGIAAPHVSVPAVPFASVPAPPPLPPRAQGDATGGIIPYKNPQALTAYYLAIFGLFPVVGIFLAIPAVILGCLGLKKRKQNPIIKGSVHAWIGIVLGALSILYNGLLLVVIGVGMFA